MDAVNQALVDENAVLKAQLAVALAKASEDMALIAAQKLQIAKLQRQIYGQKSERSARLLDQLSLELEELEASATEDELAAERAVARTTTVAGFERKRPERKTFPDHLPRERVVVEAPKACACCGGARLRKLGEDVTQTLETTPRQWKVVETVREKFTCRDCEKITQAPAPFHVVARGWAGPSLLAMIAFEKFGQHQPLNRQAERYALEGAPIALSTMADAIGSICAALDPLRRLVEAHVLAAERLHGDDTTVPVLAKGKTDTGRCWVYVREDAPFGGAEPPAAMFYYSRDRRGEHPQGHLANWSGILQADAYDGYGKLYLAGREPGPIREAACWVHARRPFFAMADIDENARRRAAGKKEIPLSPIAIEIVRRIELVVCDRAVDQRQERRRASRRPTSVEPPARPSAGRLSARTGHEAVARARSRQGDPVYAEALARLHAVPRRRARVHVEQRRRARTARHSARSQILVVLRLRPRRPARRGDVQPDRHRKDERRRSAGLARRCSLAHCRASGSSTRRVAALELASTGSAGIGAGGVSMHVNKVDHVTTVDRVADHLGESVDLIHDVALEMDAEDGAIWVYGVGDDGVLAFTDLGIETLIELIEIHKDFEVARRSLARQEFDAAPLRPTPDGYRSTRMAFGSLAEVQTSFRRPDQGLGPVGRAASPRNLTKRTDHGAA